MKRASFLIAALLGWLCCSLPAQPNDAADALERKANEERYNNLRNRIAAIEETQELLIRRYGKLEQQLEILAREIQKLRDDSGRSGANFATREELKAYVEKLREIERKREEDNQLLLKGIKDLAKMPPISRVEPKPSNEHAEAGPNYTIYKVKETGETLGDIIKEYNKKFKEEGRATINLDQVVKENENMNPNVIRIGQSIRIPIPPRK